MKKIMNARIIPTQTDGEYQWIESSEAEYSAEWDGNIEGYLDNLDLDDLTVSPADGYNIHNANGFVLVSPDGTPVEMYWIAED